MRKKSKARRRGRRAGIFASLAATAAMMVATVGAAPAQGATDTGWIPLRCALAGSIPVAVGAALTATVPDTVAPGDDFAITGTTTLVLFPGTAQQAAAVFGANGLQGIVTIFETNLVNASVAFADTPVATPVQSSPTQFNAVGAVQPPNQPAVVGPSGPRINGGDTTRGGFQPATPPESFSFGDAPADTTGNTGNRYAPAPGVGGGTNPTDGTADVIPDIGPITATGADGDTITIKNINPGGPLIGAGINEPRVVQNQVSFHQGGDPGTYTSALPADCAFDARPEDPTVDEPGGDEVGDDGSVPKPVAEWVDQFDIPIEDVGPVDGVGSASARGTAFNHITAQEAQFSAITNCDEAQNTRPFYVRWTEGTTTHLFKRTSTGTSTCSNITGSDTNDGTGAGTIDGATTAFLSWTFVNNPDHVLMSISTTDQGPVVFIDEAPGELSGTPGGVWVFGELPWPGGT
jgi:hypothetical protein